MNRHGRKKVAVVILSYNVKKDILECLESLEKSDQRRIEVVTIVVDNGSTDDSIRVLSQIPRIILRKQNENLGYTGGNNIGIKNALSEGCEYILILNPDTIVSENLLSDLVNFMERSPQYAIIGPKIYFAPGYEYHKKYTKEQLGHVFWHAGGILDRENVLPSNKGVDEVDQGQYNSTVETDFVSGCAMFIRATALKSVGFFDEKYFLYLEDLDFCQRAKTQGLHVAYVPIGAVWHKNAQSSDVGSSVQDYYISRNRLLFASQYLAFRTKLAIFREAVKIYFGDNLAKKKGVRDFFLRRFGKGSL